MKKYGSVCRREIYKKNILEEKSLKITETKDIICIDRTKIRLVGTVKWLFDSVSPKSSLETVSGRHPNLVFWLQIAIYKPPFSVIGYWCLFLFVGLQALLYHSNLFRASLNFLCYETAFLICVDIEDQSWEREKEMLNRIVSNNIFVKFFLIISWAKN